MKRGIGKEDQMHINFGLLMQHYEFYKKLKCSHWSYQPFGEQRTKLTGALLKKKGTKKGVPDYLFIKNKEGIAEMIWLEFKAEKGKQSEEQLKFQTTCELFKNMNYYMPRSVEEAIKILEKEQIL